MIQGFPRWRAGELQLDRVGNEGASNETVACGARSSAASSSDPCASVNPWERRPGGDARPRQDLHDRRFGQHGPAGPAIVIVAYPGGSQAGRSR